MRGAPVLQTVYALISLISPTQESKHHWDGPQLTSDDDDEDDGYDDNDDGDDDGDGDIEDRLLHLLTFFPHSYYEHWSLYYRSISSW